MAASKWQVYNEAKKWLLTGQVDLDTSAMRMKIVAAASSAAVSNYTRSTFASIVGVSTNLRGTALRTILGIAVTTVGSAKQIMFDATENIFTASGGAFSVKYAVIGVSGGKALAWCKLSTAAIAITAGNTLKITPSATGFFTLTGGDTA